MWASRDGNELMRFVCSCAKNLFWHVKQKSFWFFLCVCVCVLAISIFEMEHVPRLYEDSPRPLIERDHRKNAKNLNLKWMRCILCELWRWMCICLYTNKKSHLTEYRLMMCVCIKNKYFTSFYLSYIDNKEYYGYKNKKYKKKNFIFAQKILQKCLLFNCCLLVIY